LQGTYGQTKKVTAIVPRLGIEPTPATASASSPRAGNDEAKGSFSGVLEQAISSPTTRPAQFARSSSASEQPAQENSANVGGATRREAKPSESRTSNSPARGDSVRQNSTGRPDSPSTTVAPVAVQPTSEPVLNWKSATSDFTSGVSGEDTNQSDVDNSNPNNSLNNSEASGSGTLSPSPVTSATVGQEAIGGSILPQLSFNNIDPAALQGDPQDSGIVDTPGAKLAASEANVIGQFGPPAVTPSSESKVGDSKIADSKLKIADSKAVDSKGEGQTLLSSLRSPLATAGPVSPAKTPQSSETAPARDASRPCSVTGDNSKNPAAAKSEGEQLAPLSDGPPPVPFVISASANPDSCIAQVSTVDATEDQSAISGTQSTAAQQGIEASSALTTSGTKAQSRKDDSLSALNSLAADQGAVSTPAKGIEASPFAVAGSQLSSAISDNKNPNAGLSPQAADQQKDQLEQESTGVAQSDSHLETPLYPAALINSGKLIERMGEAELRLGIRTGEFGSVDIRTSMVRNELTAEISVERGELGRILAAELPGLQTRLTEHGGPVTNVTLQNHAAGDSTSTASEQQKPRQGQQAYAPNPAGGPDEPALPALVALEGTTSASRLDIHM